MKKVLILGLACTLFLTGCGSKKLTCTISEEDSGMKMSGEVVFTFDGKGETIKKGNFNMNVQVEEKYAEYLDEMEEEFKEDYGDLKEVADVSINTKDNKISVNIKYNAAKLNEDQKDELYFNGLYSDENYENTKAEFEEDGYTCK